MKCSKPCTVCGVLITRSTSCFRWGRAVCSAECQRVMRSADASRQAAALPDWPTRFWSHVNKDGPTQGHMVTPCWLWTLAPTPDGYGQFGFEGKNGVAHRLSFFLTYGSLPEGLFICHNCDNPRCVRPDHLYAGTHQQNMDDKSARGRVARLVGSANPAWKGGANA